MHHLPSIRNCPRTPVPNIVHLCVSEDSVRGLPKGGSFVPQLECSRSSFFFIMYESFFELSDAV